ncbi:BrnT family toxin [Synechococcus elongatus]|uniref:Toxin n=3 Tax=Synechococcus elongatus TaxID=32046 RepID=Q31R77_SYNE7|nr:BrnT family toxin [Synechococcus elongatus]ABB56442.1 conserved hypothetical protein [Synechococcus elongatus PCC 7942 = FACHB-805]MBD2588279.1 BrnT family toxin [Synechococcus elongatus FACHB-242]MBD2689347.1 BrnT family toxin [Synechococcus elongatus FACHB-1061]MBD2707013.1 BrnT family toxin [Synechococcus elongatus PCC 7942 = FACHB-805]UOW70197.1 Ribonuclease toxin, BrnT, of type II toxin-antitoxin system [Synechococcus elongatus PCC 7943]
MKAFCWDAEKNKQLKAERGVQFEQVVLAIQQGQLLDILQHHNPEKYPHQRIFIVKFNNYIYCVPFIEDDQTIFLKTIIPNRKMTKRYRGS